MEPGYEIYEYSRRGSLKNLREALAEGIKPDLYMAYDGSTALVMAARTGNSEIVQELLAHNASTQARTDEGSTLLHHAVSGHSADVVRQVLQAGANVDEPNEDGVSPLILAAHYGVLNIVRLLCDAGANLELCVDGWGTPLDSASDPEVVEFLEKRGAKRSENGQDQPVAAAAERFHYGCFESGENPASQPTTAPVPSRKATVGDYVQLRRPKAGVLQEGDVGKVLEDDGSDSVPLKVAFEDKYDYYDYQDVVVCEEPVVLPPDSDRATAEGTARYTGKRMHKGIVPSKMGSEELSISPVGFGCHRIEDNGDHRKALKLALTLGCNFVDCAPNYTDGVAETVVGETIREFLESKKIRRDEIVVASKVGNVLGQQMKHADGISGMARINDALCHCIAPEWIEQELTRSLERLQLKCLDCLLLHCPETEAKDPNVDMEEVYARLKRAFEQLEKEVSKGRISMYGVSAAFQPLRPTDPEHLDLHRVMAQLPEKHHFRVLQFPMNFAEAKIKWQGHVPRHADGTAIDKDKALEAQTLFEAAKSYGLTTLINRPLDGIYKETHGVLRFSSLDCDVRSFSELQLDNCDQLEEKLTNLANLGDAPYNMPDCGTLAAKSVKILSDMDGVDCVLVGMRQPEYVLGTLGLSLAMPPVPKDVALATFKALHNTVEMWFATAIHEADHGTAKDWRLPTRPDDVAVGA